jgi:hypothetical protein
MLYVLKASLEWHKQKRGKTALRLHIMQICQYPTYSLLGKFLQHNPNF